MKLRILRIFLILALLGISASSYAYYGQYYLEHMVNTWWYYSWDPDNDDNKTNQRNPDVAMVRGTGAYAGYFVIVWESYNQYSDENSKSYNSKWDIYAMRFQNDKTPIDGATDYEVYINETTYPEYTYDHVRPSVSTDDDGNIVIAWQRGANIYYRLWSFSEGANTISSTIKLVSGGGTDSQSPTTGMADDGTFAISWYYYYDVTNQRVVRSMLFDSAGNALIYDDTNSGDSGTYFAVSTIDPNTDTSPSLDMNGSGDFVISWQTYKGSPNLWEVHARKYYWIGNQLNDYGEMTVNTSEPYTQTMPSSAIDESGNFVIAWQALNQPGGNSWDVYAQLYEADADPIGTEFKVNELTQTYQMYPDVDMDHLGNFVVVWQSFSNEDSDPEWGIRGKEFEADGSVKEYEFQVNETTIQNQTWPAVAALRVYNSGPLKLFWVTTWQGDQLCTVDDIYYKLYDYKNEGAITLESFTAFAERSKVVLNWKTGTEIDNLGFYLVRSENLESGYKLLNSNLIPSSGNITSGNQYSYTDVNVRSGSVYYYWLVSVDVDGSYDVYGPVDVITYLTTK